MARSGEEFIIVQTLDQVETGQELRSIPPHVTALSWFVLDRLNLGPIISSMGDLAHEHGALASMAVGRERVLYGVDEDIPACTVDVQTDALHLGLKEAVDAAGGAYKYERFVKKWSPHITDEAGVSIQPGQLINFASLVLFSRQDDEQGKRKMAEYSAPLGEQR